MSKADTVIDLNAAPAGETADSDNAWHTVQRVIFPDQSQMDTVLLYVDTGTAMGAAFNTMDGSMASSSKNAQVTATSSVAAPQGEVHVEDFTSRTSGTARPGQRLSFGTYFNAFAASYWRRWTSIENVRLQVATMGDGVVSVYRSNARGSLQHVETRRVAGEEISTFDLPLKPFGDGGWYWFDLIAGSKPMTLQSAEWQAPGPAKAPGSVTLEITTLNKNDFCLNNLRILADNPDALEHLQEVLIVDQGTKKVKDAPGFAEIEARFNGKLRIIHQGNLGGSGGFARGMYEAVENDSDYALLLDDDVVVKEQRVVAVVFDGLIHAAGKTTGTTKVALVDNAQLAVEARLDFREARRVLHLLGALVNDQDLLEMFQGIGVVSKDPKIVEAEIVLVEGGDFQSHRSRGLGGAGSLPFRALQRHRLGAGNKVEPVPAPVAEGLEREIEGRNLLAGYSPGLHMLQ